ncbi:MAG TPA: hypothetical protein VIV60_26755, partial [Polyangiaceae bacterium]
KPRTMPTNTSTRRPRFIRVEFAPASGCLGSIVQIVTDFCRNVVDDQETYFAFQLAAYELIENLVKYSSGESVTVRIEVESTQRGPELVLTTENQASAERIADVDASLNAAESAQDPVAHFDRLVQESLASKGESRLGLGRLRAEGDLVVSHRVQGDVIQVQARRPVHRQARDPQE